MVKTVLSILHECATPAPQPVHLAPLRPPRRSSLAAPMPASATRLGDDLRLFALTFAGGFLFMTVYLA